MRGLWAPEKVAVEGCCVGENKTPWERTKILDSEYKDFGGKQLMFVWFRRQNRNKRGSYREADLGSEKEALWLPNPTLVVYICYTTPDIWPYYRWKWVPYVSSSISHFLTHFLPCLGHIFQPCFYQGNLLNPWVSPGLPCALNPNFEWMNPAPRLMCTIRSKTTACLATRTVTHTLWFPTSLRQIFFFHLSEVNQCFPT